MPEKVEKIKLVAGGYKIPATLTYEGKRIFVQFPYNKSLLTEIRAFEGARWHGYDEINPRKIWSITNSLRNQFQLKFLMGENPYSDYDHPLIDVKTNRPLYKHQYQMVSFGVTRRYCILACEMGTGKSLAAIEVIEHLDYKNEEVWYVGPRGGVYAVGRELVKWESKVRPRMFTYESLVRTLKADSTDADFEVPKCVILDESSKIKTPTAQRSEAALYIANAVRETHGKNGCVMLLSGTPAPKNPSDWYNQAEVACPGFLKEGNINKFKARMCLIEERQSITGGVYPHVVTWLDDENKCGACGQIKDHSNHRPFIPKEAGLTVQDQIADVMSPDVRNLMVENEKFHNFKNSVNEVSYLYQRLKGLVLVIFKKDCLDLPEKQYRIIRVKTTPEILRAAKLIKTMSTRAVQALTLLRELSDGFQYTETKVADDVCPNCQGAGVIEAFKVPEGVDPAMTPARDLLNPNLEKGTVTCDLCQGTKTVPRYERTTEVVTSPKDQHFIDLLDEHEEVGRFIVWGGFTGTIDRLLAMAHEQGWATLRIDGRGFLATDIKGEPALVEDFLDAMDLSNPRYKELMERYPRICTIGNPGAGGMALTLTASPTELYYSNTFSGEARMQSEDRFHRMGMDKNRGATIIDLIHLPSDELVLNNLKLKKKLQEMSMSEIEAVFNEESERKV